MKEGQDEVLASSSSASIMEGEEDSVSADSQYDDEVENFLLMGLSKGSVIFVKVQQLSLIYARFSVHKQGILHVHEMKKEKAIITMCEDNELKIWGFKDNMMQIWRNFNVQRPISTMKVIDSPTMILTTFASGESYYFRWSNKSKNLRIVLPDENEYYNATQKTEVLDEYGEVISSQQSQRKSKTEHYKELLRKGLLMNGIFEHDDEVHSIDVHGKYKLIASGDEQGLIKIWNYRRQLIREIKFTEPITAVCFLNARADLVVGHGGKLSRILSKDYLPD